MRNMSIGKFAKATGVSIETLRNWDRDDKLKPTHVSPSGFRYYTQEQELVEDLIQIVTVFSCRLQGKRANKAKKMIAELVENDTK